MSKKQSIVSKSSIEAEYRKLDSDNKFAIYLANNPSFHEISKHIELNCHIIGEKIQSQLIHLLPVPSSSQPVDIFTKPPPSTSFNSIASKLGLCDIHSQLERKYYLI